VSCESRHSNPAPRLRWFLGDREIVTTAEQQNTTEDGDSRRSDIRVEHKCRCCVIVT
jgi:hypothetical protein